jgi:hypothetical protein
MRIAVRICDSAYRGTVGDADFYSVAPMTLWFMNLEQAVQ